MAKYVPRLNTPDEQERFLSVLGVHHCDPKLAADAANLDLRDLQYTNGKNRKFAQRWTAVFQEKSGLSVKQLSMNNSLAVKTTSIQRMVEAGLLGTIGQFVETLDISGEAGSKGRREFLEFMKVYAKMLPVETAADIHQRNEVIGDRPKPQELDEKIIEMNERVQLALKGKNENLLETIKAKHELDAERETAKPDDSND